VNDEVARLRAALQDIIDHRPSTEGLPDGWEAEVRACPECQRAEARNWPPSGLCDRHYRDVMVRDDRDRSARAYQHVEMRDIARAALSDSV
jgi:hypothetical protein